MDKPTGFGIAILAAGAATRFGSPKQSADVGGNMPMVRRAALEALKVNCHRVAVVVGAHSHQTVDAIGDLPVDILDNAKWSLGMSTSIRASVDWAIAKELGGLLVVCCDQIAITQHELQELANASHQDGTRGTLPRIACAMYGEDLGVPAYFPSEYFDELMNLEGDKGAKKLLLDYRDCVIGIAMSAAAIDVDTVDDLQQAVPGTGVI